MAGSSSFVKVALEGDGEKPKESGWIGDGTYYYLESPWGLWIITNHGGNFVELAEYRWMRSLNFQTIADAKKYADLTIEEASKIPHRTPMSYLIEEDDDND